MRSAGTRWSAEDDKTVIGARAKGLSWRRIRGLLTTERSTHAIALRYWLLTSNKPRAVAQRKEEVKPSLTPAVVADKNMNASYDLILYAIQSNFSTETKRVIVKTLAEQL